MLIYKILRADEWEALLQNGETEGAPIDVSDGYVHFSTAAQAPETAAKYFANADGLMLLAYEADGLNGLKWEPSRGGALFPHLYAPLRLDQMRWHCALPIVNGVHAFPDDIGWNDQFVDPERAQFDAFKALPRDTEIHMLNLVRLRASAKYTQELSGQYETGQEAYEAYGRQSGPVFSRVGGSILWRATFETGLIGPAPEIWDAMFIARYPSANAFLEMVTDKDYQKAVVHRQAAVETSRLIRCAPSVPGDTFG